METRINKYILTEIDVASRYRAAKPLRTKKSTEVAFALEAIYKKSVVFKYPKVFQIGNGSEFKNEVVVKLLEKHNVDIQRATTKYKKTHTVFVNRWMLKSFKTLRKYSQFGSKI